MYLYSTGQLKNISILLLHVCTCHNNLKMMEKSHSWFFGHAHKICSWHALAYARSAKKLPRGNRNLWFNY